MVASVSDLRVGDRINVTVDGRTYEMTVWRIYNDPSLGWANSLTALAHIRPGGYGVSLRNDNLGKYAVTRVRESR
jgi:hypothetical protein